MRYLCTSCSYIYDEGLGDTQEGISSGTKFDSLSDYFCCPVCGDDQSSFHEIAEEVNYIEGDMDRDFVEQEHYINLCFIEDTLKISVGKPIHPSGEDHRITQISLYDEYGELIEETFLSILEEPEIEFDISDLDDFEVRVTCSIHGVWGRKVSRD